MKKLLMAITTLLIPMMTLAGETVIKRDLSPEEIMLTTALSAMGFLLLFIALMGLSLIKVAFHLLNLKLAADKKTPKTKVVTSKHPVEMIQNSSKIQTAGKKLVQA
jgi:hypothetical protein